MRKSLFVCLAICLTLSFSVWAQKASSDVPVTVKITDYVDVLNPASGTTQRIPMHVQSDGAAYQHSSTVVSVIQGNGDLLVDTTATRTPTRKVFLDFSQPIAGSAPGGGNPIAPFTSNLVHPLFRSKSWSQYGINMFDLDLGQTVLAPLTIGFDYPIGSSTRYRIHMTPGEQSSFTYTSTDFVNMTCARVDAKGMCNWWQLKPNGAKGGCITTDCSVKRNVVKLVKLVTTKGGVTTAYDQGDFYMTFAIDITNP